MKQFKRSSFEATTLFLIYYTADKVCKKTGGLSEC